MTTNDDDMVTSPLSELDSEAMLDLQQHDEAEEVEKEVHGDDDEGHEPHDDDEHDDKEETHSQLPSHNSPQSPSTGATTVDNDKLPELPVQPISNGRKASLLNPADLSDDSSELSELEDSEAETERLYLNDLVDEEEESFKRRRESSSEDHIRQMKREREEDDERDIKRARVNGGIDETEAEEDTTAKMDVDTTAKAEADLGADTGMITEGAIKEALEETAAAPETAVVPEAAETTDAPLPVPVEDVEDGPAEEVNHMTESKAVESPPKDEATKDMPTPINQTEPSDNEHEDDKEEEEETKETKVEEDEDKEEDEEKEEEDNDDAEDEDKDTEKVDMRPAAMTSLAEIEVDFAKLRDFMFKEKLAAFEVEMGLCVKGTHPELHAVYEQISKMRDDKIKLAKTRRKYKLQCINNQTKASRVQIHQQFLKDQGDARSGLLLKTTEEWYRVNRERRAMDLMVPDYGYTIPESKSEQIHQRNAQVNEISLLSGISKYVGFPAAPVISQATEEETNEDLTALGLQRPPVPHATFTVPPGIMQPMAVPPSLQPLQQQPPVLQPPPHQQQQQTQTQQQQQQPPHQTHQQAPSLPPQQQHQPTPPPHTQQPPMGQHRLNGHEQQHMPLPLGAPLMMQHPMYHQVPPIYGGYQYPAVPYYQGGNLLPPPQTMYGHPQMYGQVLPPPYIYQKREEDHE